MYGLAKHPFIVTTGKCVTEDERRDVVKGHADSSSTFLPARQTELSAFWKALIIKGHSRIVCRLHVDSITPPILDAVQANRAILSRFLFLSCSYDNFTLAAPSIYRYSASEPRSKRSGTTVSERPSATSHNFLAFPRSHRRRRLIPFASHALLLSFSLLHDQHLSPRPPAKYNCERIEDVPAFTATHKTTLSPTAFPSSHLWITMTDSNHKGTALRCPSYRVFSVIS